MKRLMTVIGVVVLLLVSSLLLFMGPGCGPSDAKKDNTGQVSSKDLTLDNGDILKEKSPGKEGTNLPDYLPGSFIKSPSLTEMGHQGFSAKDSDKDLAVILVIDVSGSMSRTDPDKLRKEAAKVFIDLTRQGDYVGVLAFDHEVETVIPLVEAGSVANKNRLKDELTDRLAPRGSTDFAGAFEKALEKFANFTPSDSTKEDLREVMVFLTDGDPNPDPSRRDEPEFLEEYMETVWELVDDFARRDTPVYTIGFGEVDKPEILEKISADTGGKSYYLEGSKDLSVSIFNIMSSLTGNTSLYRGEIGQGTNKEKFNFVLNNYTRQVNLLLLGEAEEVGEINLTTPTGEEIILPRDFSKLSDVSVSVVTEEGYTLMVIDNDLDRKGKNIGPWQLTLKKGSGELYVDEVNFVKTFIEAPAFGSNHPIEGDIDVRVRVEGIDEEIIDSELLNLFQKSQSKELTDKELQASAKKDNEKNIKEKAPIEDTGKEDIEYIEDMLEETNREELAVEVLLLKPVSRGYEVEANTLLEGDGDGYYRGTLKGNNLSGERYLKARVIYQGVVLSQMDSRINLIHAPRITTDLRLQEIYPQKEQLTATAFLNMGGTRLVEGEGSLEVDAFKFFMEEVNTSSENSYSFNDEGKDGDIREGDGIWTSQINLKEKGDFRAYLDIEGNYRGEDFDMRKELGKFSVVSPGHVEVIFREGPHYGARGKKALVTFEATNHSSFSSDVFIEYKEYKENEGDSDNAREENGEKTPGEKTLHEDWYLKQAFNLDPGESREMRLDLVVPAGLENGSYFLPLELEVEGKTGILVASSSHYLAETDVFGKSLTAAAAKEQETEKGYEKIQIEVIPYSAYIFRNLGFYLQDSFTFLGVLVGGGLFALYVAGGALCYHKKVRPLQRLYGSLKYWPETSEKSRSTGLQEEINFEMTLRDEMVIVLGKDFSKLETDLFYMYRLDDFDSTYNLEIQLQGDQEKANSSRKRFFSRLNKGWNSLKKEIHPPPIVVKTTPPGVIKRGSGEIRTRLELYHGDVFMTGGYVFLYLNENREDEDTEEIRGKNLLEKDF